MAETVVVWVGTAGSAPMAIPCPSCNAAIGRECTITWLGGGIGRARPHKARCDIAAAIGFREVKRGSRPVEHRARRRRSAVGTSDA